ncbi:MAG: SusC/RagA family TonB-linked outer membrane protein [Tannerella sp.]|jgi:TonB-linked SusC/RagA family outer membrane protein|nr:SusC/RagA family TonB-linked outer membrane protein [Tannerella sp.]
MKEKFLSILQSFRALPARVAGMTVLAGWLCCVATQGAAAQDGYVVSGAVTDVSGEPLAGVNIVQKDAAGNGTVTDVNGKYSLRVTRQHVTLTFSYIGFTTQDAVASGSVVNVVMKEDLQNLEEVVVIGYGTAKKRDLTGAISTVKTENLAAEAPRTVQDLLRANSAGISTTMSTNAKGNADLQIRGKNSLKASTSPLLVVDGVIYEGALEDINPMDIETIDILKDASSAAVYGAKSANGVVVINTKRGRSGKPLISFNANVGIAQAADVPAIYDEQSILDWRYDYERGKRTDEYLAQYPQMFVDPRKLQGVSQLDWYNYDQGTPVSSVTEDQLLTTYLSRLEFKAPEIANYLKRRFTNWSDLVLQTGLQQDYTVGISNQTDNLTYYWSLGYADREGIVVDDAFSTVRTRLNLESKITDWLSVGMNTGFSSRDESSIPCIWGNMIRVTPFAANEIGNPDVDEFLILFPGNDREGPNPFYENMYRDRKKMYTTLNSNLYARLTLPFGFEYQMNYIPRYQFYEYYNHDSSGNFEWTAKGGESTRETEKIFSWQIDNILRWKREFNRIHNVEVTLLANAEQYQSWKQKMSTTQFSPSDVLGYHRMQAGTIPLNESDDQYQTGDALMGRVFYSLRNKYMLTASIRRDGFSAFGQRHPRATFPALALGWVFTSERFMEPLADVFSYGKLRFSWGQNGNRSIGRYDALSDMTSGAHPYIDQNGNIYISSQLYVNRMSNAGLKWESTASYNVGLDFALLGDRLSGTIEGYLSHTNDLLVDRALPEITGFSSVAANLGQIANRGLEITLNANVLNTQNLNWTSSVNFSLNRRKIVHLYGDMVDVLDDAGNVTGQKEADDVKNKWFIGQDPDRIWDYERLGVWQANEKEEAAKYGLQPGDFKYWDRDGDGVLTDDDKTFQGYKTPRFRWTWRNEFNFMRDFTFSFMLYSYWGQYDQYNYAANTQGFPDRNSDYVRPRWTPENPINDYARIGSKNLGTYYLERSFIRLDNVTLSYNVPKNLLRKIKVENLRLSASVRNAAVFSPHWNFWDPERGWNYSDNKEADTSTPTPRTFNLSLNFTL